MKMISLIFATLTVLSTNFAMAKSASATLKCQGSVDKSYKISALIKTSGTGFLVINGNRLPLSLESIPGDGSSNYWFSTQDDTQVKQYSIVVRSYLLDEKSKQRTDAIKLFIRPEFSTYQVSVDLSCEISYR